jgi:UDP-GlcNAc:undecaprenyl-phosphate/decaprenyl-phosphate GlcNAc-1-phosphate transferase
MATVITNVANYLLVMFVVALVARLLTPFALQLSLEDHPSHRKLHAKPVPLLGGVAMLSGLIVGILMVDIESVNTMHLIYASFIIFAVGLIDDRSETTVTARLFFQISVSLLVVSYSGIEINSFGNIIYGKEAALNLNGLSVFVSVLAIAGGMNALNVMDGIDGLSSGLSLTTLTSVFFLSYINNSYDIVQLCLIYICILVPFIVLNLSTKYKIFMGDSGVYLIGFGVVWILIQSSQGEGVDKVFSPVIALWLFAIPLIDIFAVVLLRLKCRVSPFLPDHKHIHYQLIEKYNLSSLKSLFVILLVAIIIAVIGIIGSLLHTPEWLMFAGFAALTVIYTITLFQWNS